MMNSTGIVGIITQMVRRPWKVPAQRCIVGSVEAFPREFLSYSVCHVYIPQDNEEKANAVTQTREWHLLMSHQEYHSEQVGVTTVSR